MASLLLLWDIASDTGTLSAAGSNPGAWVETGNISLQNLRTDDVAAVARYTDIAHSTARIRVAMDRPRPLSVFALVGHNASETATFQPLLSTNADLSAPIYQPAPQPFWEPTVVWGSQPFGVFPFSGVDIAGYPGAPIAWHQAPDTFAGQYLSVDIADPANGAGYFQAGRLLVGQGYTPPINISYGSSIGIIDPSDRKRTDGGRRLVRRRPRYRSWKLVLEYQTEEAAMGVYHDLMWRKGVGGDLLVLWDPDADAPIRGRQTLYGALAGTTDITNTHLGRWSVTFEIEELI